MEKQGGEAQSQLLIVSCHQEMLPTAEMGAWGHISATDRIISH